tara:strand:- start:4497 stop:4691 length:195 start_codon:yes stop_codon:yes gene_type:complete
MPTYNQIIESFINGQYSQAWSQFKDLGEWEMSGFSSYIQGDEMLKESEKVKYLCYLLDKKVSQN